MNIDILDKSYQPLVTDFNNYFENQTQKRWHNLLDYITKNTFSKPAFFYSKCSAKPGWNLKYKRGNKALCTIYPDKDYFTVLIVLNSTDMLWFDGIKKEYSNYTINLFNNCTIFNGTKWLMISVTDDAILDDVKSLIHLKSGK